MSQQNKNITFAYWVPNVSGGLVVSNIEQRTDWSYDYNVRLAQAAEKNGFDYALTQIRFTAGYNAENQHESVSFSHGILAKTSKLKSDCRYFTWPVETRACRKTACNHRPLNPRTYCD